jgi:phosphoenolpyruvate synthase/pyruvate phosphate dikinase
MVSHVQLLARNLGIPNAVLSADNLQALKAWSGREVFYAVSPRGTVVLKLASAMDAAETALFATAQKERQRIRVPLDKMDLSRREMINLRELTAASSGRWCGPKAANLGQLKRLFPAQVVEGFVIPFGAFRAHMDQPMPGRKGTYWDYLQEGFARAEVARGNGISAQDTESGLLRRLDTLRQAIQQMNFLPGFEQELERAFAELLGQPLGDIPVFLRSDTNMEDLPDFTGAGLNLTLFNVRERSRILQGIREVWASPYTERSFRWRQQYLLNPENVYPSLLIIPGVNVDYSGVVITKGVARGIADEITTAFSWGVGGAVDGQRAETYLIYPGGYLDLLSPARELEYKYLPRSGGVEKGRALPQQPILNLANLTAIYELAAAVESKFPEAEGGGVTAYDIELGFQDDKLWLFQVRPFVENSQVATSTYLRELDPRFDPEARIDLTQKI